MGRQLQREASEGSANPTLRKGHERLLGRNDVQTVMLETGVGISEAEDCGQDQGRGELGDGREWAREFGAEGITESILQELGENDK